MNGYIPLKEPIKAKNNVFDAEWGLMIRGMLEWLILNPNATLKDIGVKSEIKQTPFGDIEIIKPL